MNRRRFVSCALCAVTGLVATHGDAQAQAMGGVNRVIRGRRNILTANMFRSW